jgi:hypothetical protein
MPPKLRGESRTARRLDTSLRQGSALDIVDTCFALLADFGQTSGCPRIEGKREAGLKPARSRHCSRRARPKRNARSLGHGVRGRQGTGDDPGARKPAPTGPEASRVKELRISATLRYAAVPVALRRVEPPREGDSLCVRPSPSSP